ncbi:hypothetical protein AB0H71_05955 [Nocardia sp. NPDC050697]|uniref:hypothetical protein n=1 Tax=Nocardia sp. NPDC050697 TaxID=3155158 RepID=UPI003400E11C
MVGHEVTGGEGAEQQRDRVVAGGEEQRREVDREHPVEREVVVLDEGPDESGHGRATGVRRDPFRADLRHFPALLAPADFPVMVPYGKVNGNCYEVEP